MLTSGFVSLPLFACMMTRRKFGTLGHDCRGTLSEVSGKQRGIAFEHDGVTIGPTAADQQSG